MERPSSVSIRFSLIQGCTLSGTILLLGLGLTSGHPEALVLSSVLALVALFPVSVLMKHQGRKRGLAVGVGSGLVGALLILAGQTGGQVPLVYAGFAVYGLHQAFLQFLRYMAIEAAGWEKGPGALAWVVVGGVPAAVFSFWVGTGGDAGLLVVVLILEAVLVASLPGGRRTTPEPTDRMPPRRWPLLATDPSFWLALGAVSFSYGLALLVSAAVSPSSLPAFLLAMSVPSVVSGRLVRWWGPRRLVGAGLAFFILELILALQGGGFGPPFVSVALAGLGWNFLYTGGTVLLVSRYRLSEKYEVQAFSESFVFLSGSLAALTAVVWTGGLGREGTPLLAVPLLTLVGALLLLTRPADQG